MAKMKFYINIEGENLRTIDDLRNNFFADGVLKHYHSGKLAKWLDAWGYDRELEQVRAIQTTDARGALAELGRIFDVEVELEDIKANLSIDDYLKGYKIENHDEGTLQTNNENVSSQAERPLGSVVKKARVIMITSGKGGVGKTTLTTHIAEAMKKLNKSVIILDQNTGSNNIASQCEMSKPYCDFILLDCPAAIDDEFKFENTAAIADEVLVVTTPLIPAVRDADCTIGMLESMGKSRICFIINRLHLNMSSDGDILTQEDIIDVLSIPLIGVVPEGPVIYMSGSPVAQACLNIAERLLGKDVPFMNS